MRLLSRMFVRYLRLVVQFSIPYVLPYRYTCIEICSVLPGHSHSLVIAVALVSDDARHRDYYLHATSRSNRACGWTMHSITSTSSLRSVCTGLRSLISEVAHSSISKYVSSPDGVPYSQEHSSPDARTVGNTADS